MIKLIKSTFYREATTTRALKQFLGQAPILSFNTHCQGFETAFAKWQGTQQAVFVNSGSSANLAIIQALLNLGRLKKGDAVGFSAVTWSTNVMPLIQLGLNPVPIDVELDTLNISPQQLEKTLTKIPLKAVFITHLLGFCDDMAGIAKLCQDRNLILLEDTCEAMGSVYQGKKLGNFGLASTFSFYVGHHMSTIEGGMICTNDEELAVMLRIVRAHGWDRNLAEADQAKVRSQFKVNSSFYSRYTFYDLGYNLRPTELAGFLGQFQLQFADEICTKRERNFTWLAKRLYTLPQYHQLRFDHLDKVSNFAVPLICQNPADRAALVKRCARRVEIRPIVGGNMVDQPFFKKYVPAKYWLPTPNAKLIHRQGFYFGNNPELTTAELRTLAEVFGSRPTT